MRQTYRRSCHCGRVRFEADADLDHVRACDCSICRRRGALIHRVSPECFRLLTPLEELATSMFNTHAARDYVCRVCGILPFRRSSAAPGAWATNVRCLEEVHIDAIPVRRVHGDRLS
ncbi:MAG TPA: GFA family protein [Acetobacteraceae bacterium]|nr:GFA family protein [Acetobacteraceae bacterium]